MTFTAWVKCMYSLGWKVCFLQVATQRGKSENIIYRKLNYSLKPMLELTLYSTEEAKTKEEYTYNIDCLVWIV